jgi:hypothetical protein
MKLISILSEDLGKWFGKGKTGGWAAKKYKELGGTWKTEEGYKK